MDDKTRISPISNNLNKNDLVLYTHVARRWEYPIWKVVNWEMIVWRNVKEWHLDLIVYNIQMWQILPKKEKGLELTMSRKRRWVTQKEMSHARARSVKRRCDLLFQEPIDQSAPGYLSDLLHNLFYPLYIFSYLRWSKGRINNKIALLSSIWENDFDF